MSYYQVAESCRLQTSDWNSKWDLSSLTALGQSTSSSAYTPISISTPNQESDFAFLPPKLDQPYEYQHYEKPATSHNTIDLNNSATFTDSASGKFSGFSNCENRYTDDDCILLPSYHEDNYPGYSTHPFIKEEYADDFIPSGSNVDTTTGNWCHTFNENEYEYMPNQIDHFEGNRNSFNGFSRGEIEFGSTESQFRASDSALFSKNLWLRTPPLINEEYDDDVVLLGAYNTNKDVFGSTTSQFKVSDSAPYTKNQWLMTPPPFIKEDYNEDIVLLDARNTNKDIFSNSISQVRVSDAVPCSKNLWLMSSPPIREKCKDDALILGSHATNKELKNNFFHSVYTDNVSDRQNSYEVDEISNGSVELLFKRADGLDKNIPSSPSDLLQTKEIKDFLSNDQISKIEIKLNEPEVGQDIIPIPFNRRYYKCSHCIFKTNKKERLNEHVETFHLTSCYNTRNTRSRRKQNSANKDASKFGTEKFQQKNRIKNIKCSECAYMTNDCNKLKQHTEKKHFHEKVKRYNSWNQELEHQLLPAIDESHDSNQASEKIFGSKLYKCPDCTYKTHRKDCLKRHVKKAHSDESDENIRYTCFTSLGCKFESTVAAVFCKHLKLVHFGEPPFRCEDCQYKSNKTTAFLTHRVEHTGDRPYNCIECEFSCKRKYHLTGHWISHTKEKKFKCNYCTKKYSYKCSKVRHEKTSCKQKPK